MKPSRSRSRQSDEPCWEKEDDNGDDNDEREEANIEQSFDGDIPRVGGDARTESSSALRMSNQIHTSTQYDPMDKGADEALYPCSPTNEEDEGPKEHTSCTLNQI